MKTGIGHNNKRIFTSITIGFLIFISTTLVGQDIYKIKSGKVSFFAGTPVEDIDAVNSKISSFLNIKTGEVVINMKNIDFIFRRALMQEHFNENYMESEKYPKSEFKGKITDMSGKDLSLPGTYQLQVEGNLNIHGIVKPRKIDIQVVNKNNQIFVESNFEILLEDHKIERPQIVWQKIAEVVKTNINLNYEIYKK